MGTGIGGSVYHGKDVGVTLGNEKRTNYVHMEMGKTAFWNGNGRKHGGGF